MSSPDVREQYRRQVIDSIGGWSGMAVAAIPPVVFVVVNAVAGLRWAVIAALGSGVLLAAYRLARHQPVQQALTGLAGVAVAAGIAAWTGQARGYFLWGIWTSFAYAAVLFASILVRRPLVGVAWEFIDPTPALDPTGRRTVPRASDHVQVDGEQVNGEQVDGAQVDVEQVAPAPLEAPPWYRVGVLVRAYALATAAATLIFLARGVVQLALFSKGATGWLAVARIAMGYPLTVAAFGLAVLVVRRARRRVHPPAGT